MHSGHLVQSLAHDSYMIIIFKQITLDTKKHEHSLTLVPTCSGIYITNKWHSTLNYWDIHEQPSKLIYTYIVVKTKRYLSLAP